jgi:hypothetical protein
MAQTLFQIAGTAIGYSIGGPIGASIGSIVGAGIGNELFPNKIDGPKLSDLKITASTYGSPIPLVYGDSNRISGNVIWTTGIIETSSTKKVGSFPSKTKVTTYQYRLSCAIAISAGVCQNIKRIWANKKLIYEDTSLFSPTPNSQSWTVTSGVSLPTSVFYSLSFYPGDEVQTPDPTMQAYLGAGNVPSYRKICYVVFKDLQLANFGNAMPNIEIELKGIPAQNSAAVVNDICQRSNLAVDEYAISPKLVGENIAGYAVASSGSAINAINPLISAFAFTASEQKGTVRFTAKGNGSRATIEIGNLGAKEPSDKGLAENPIKSERTPDFELPKEVSITYFDVDRDFQSGTQKSCRSFGNAKSNISIELPLVLTSNLAKQIADRILWEPWSARTKVSFSLSEKFGFLNAGDVVSVFIANRYVSVKIFSITKGSNGVYEVEATTDDQYVFDNNQPGVSALTPPQEVRIVSNTVGYLFNPPIISPDQTDSSFTAAVDNPRKYWPGAYLYEFGNNLLETFDNRSSIGNCLNTLGAVSSSDVWDRANTLTVSLVYPQATLQSVEEEDVLNGANMAWVGRADGSRGEIIQFRDAAYVSPGVYVLSNLLRGRRATDHEASSHVSNEIFVLLENFSDIENSESRINITNAFKFVTVGQLPSDISFLGFRPTGEGARCRTVAAVKCSRDILTNDVSVSWVPRTRLYPPILGYGNVALGEDSEQYEIDITNSGGTIVFRTISVSSGSFVYTAAQQSADGTTPGSTVYGFIYQISATRGRGHRRRFIA